MFTLNCRGSATVITFEMAFDGRLDQRVLARAFELLLDAEPLVGHRLVVDTSPPHWEPVPHAARRRLVVAATEDQYEQVRRSGLDATANVQAEVCVWRDEHGDRLLLRMTHEVGDGVAIQGLTVRLASIYSALCVDPFHQPRPNVGTRRDMNQVLSSVPLRAYPGAIWSLLTFILPRCFPLRTHALAVPRQSAGPWVPVVVRLPAPGLQRLATYAKARGATLNDALLAGAYRALATHGNWRGDTGLRIDMTLDLRRWFLPPSDAASVCNLSSFERPFLARALGDTFDETLANVSALTRRRKLARPGLVTALLAHLILTWSDHRGLRERAARRGRPRPQRPLTLSNEGALDRVRLRFGDLLPSSAHILPPFLGLPDVQMTASSYAGVLTLAAVTPENGAPIVERFLEAVVRELPLESTASAADRETQPDSPMPWPTQEPAFDPRGADVTGGVAAYGRLRMVHAGLDRGQDRRARADRRR